MTGDSLLAPILWAALVWFTAWGLVLAGPSLDVLWTVLVLGGLAVAVTAYDRWATRRWG